MRAGRRHTKMVAGPARFFSWARAARFSLLGPDRYAKQATSLAGQCAAFPLLIKQRDNACLVPLAIASIVHAITKTPAAAPDSRNFVPRPGRSRSLRLAQCAVAVADRPAVL